MNMIRRGRPTHSRAILIAVALLTAASPLDAQTAVALSDNRYTPAEDVELGREAAGDVERQLPLLRDRTVNAYVASVGRRLAKAIPSRLQQPAFSYTFKVVDVQDANAFALPGGPIYVNRGMIAAARTEGELAGVLAHELSHVVLELVQLRGGKIPCRAITYRIPFSGALSLGRANVVRPSPPYVVPTNENKAWFWLIGSSAPSQSAQPRGAKFPANNMT